MSTRMGRYRIAMPTNSTESSRGGRRSDVIDGSRGGGGGRAGSRDRLQLLGAVVLVERDRTDEEDEEGDRHRGGDRPVPIAEEFVPQHAPDHEILRAAEQRRNHELADGGYEYQHRAGDDP